MTNIFQECIEFLNKYGDTEFKSEKKYGKDGSDHGATRLFRQLKEECDQMAKADSLQQYRFKVERRKSWQMQSNKKEIKGNMFVGDMWVYFKPEINTEIPFHIDISLSKGNQKVQVLTDLKKVVVQGYTNDLKQAAVKAMNAATKIAIKEGKSNWYAEGKNVCTNNNETTLYKNEQLEKLDLKENEYLSTVIPIDCIDRSREDVEADIIKAIEELIKYIFIAVDQAESIETKLRQCIDSGKKKQIVITGAPGTGKTYGVREYVKRELGVKSDADLEKDDRYYFVQFHPSYDYTDFVEGIRPIANIAEAEKSEDGEAKDKTRFVRMDGHFKAFCRAIVDQDIKEPCFFVIDEINRADLSKVFGELMYQMDKDYRGSNHALPTQYNNLPTYDRNGKKIEEEKDCFLKGFYIPENVYIIGTMNDIDRSVETFDFALRRRFEWIDITANSVMGGTVRSFPSIKKGISEGAVAKKINELIKNMKSMNEYIATGEESVRLGLSDGYCIGPAYCKDFDGNNEKEIWRYKIKPILLEYCRGRDEGLRESFIKGCYRKFFKKDDDSGWNEGEDELLAGAVKSIFNKGRQKQIVLAGPPGTGKTFFAHKYGKDRDDNFVQFHPSYDYTDFVEGIRPAIVNGTMQFVRMDGVFKAFCRSVVSENGDKREEALEPKYFIIDEINRADLSKVFGELMFALEEGYRGKENVVHTQYENLPTYGKDGKPIDTDCFKDGFYIPENVYIIGTMNDIDRSVESFDFALRRRFQWIYVDAQVQMQAGLKAMLKDEKTAETLTLKMKSVNEKIAEAKEVGLNRDYCIGHAYFDGYTDKDQDNYWQIIEGTLREYCRGRKKETVDTFVGECKDKFFTKKEKKPADQQDESEDQAANGEIENSEGDE